MSWLRACKFCGQKMRATLLSRHVEVRHAAEDDRLAALQEEAIKHEAQLATELGIENQTGMVRCRACGEWQWVFTTWTRRRPRCERCGGALGQVIP